MDFCANQGTSTIYDQCHLPPDAKSADSFKRWHRAARRAGVAGVWTRGKLLLAKREAWETPLERQRAGAKAPALPVDDDAQLDAALGIRAAGRR